MPIAKRYMDMIEQLESQLDELTPFEQQFIMGGEGKDGTMWPAKRDAPYLSDKVKEMLQDIYAKRIEGKKSRFKTPLPVDFDGITAKETDDGWKIQLNGYFVGHGMSRKEIAHVAEWLDQSLRAFLQLPPDATATWLTEPSLPAEEEVPQDEPEEEELPYFAEDEESETEIKTPVLNAGF